MKSIRRGFVFFVLTAAILTGCNQGDERLVEKAKLEGKAQAEAELQAQLDAQPQLIEKARLEGKAQAEEEMKVQLDNMDFLIQRARLEGRAQAEEEIKGQNANTEEKARHLETDLFNRHLFYRAVQGTYEGAMTTDRGKFRIRVTFVPSLPPYLGTRSRQLEEIISDINNLTFSAQVNLWNPSNPLSSVGCRIEGIRPDFNRGTISMASEGCPNVYLLSVGDATIAKSVKDSTGKDPSASEVAGEVARNIQAGKLTNVPQIQGELRPTTNANIYAISLQRLEK